MKLRPGANAPAPGGLNVLAITRDRAFLRQVRLVMPLAALVQAGLIGSFRVLDALDGQASAHFSTSRFDVVLLQRETPPAVVRFLAERGLPYVLDVDDLLLSAPAYSIHRPSTRSVEALVCAMQQALVLTVSNARLLAALERSTGLALAHKTRIIPNASPLAAPPERAPAKPQALLWTSSDLPALTVSGQGIIRAVRAFLVRHGLPLYLVGRFKPEHLDGAPNVRLLGDMDYWQHKHFVLNGPPLLGLAPLETLADADTQAFIDCKSDVKMVEYAGAGLPAVYSAALPYTDTDLAAGRVAHNTAQAWLDALETLYATGYRDAPAQALRVNRLRAAPRLAAAHWLPALQAARLHRPLELGDMVKALAQDRQGRPGGLPLHHRLADALFYGVYDRFASAGLRRRVGRAAERVIGWANRRDGGGGG